MLALLAAIFATAGIQPARAQTTEATDSTPSLFEVAPPSEFDPLTSSPLPSLQSASPLAEPPIDLGPPAAGRRIRLFPRGDVGFPLKWERSTDGTEYIGVIDSGVNILIEDFQTGQTVDIATDRLVIWRPAQQAADEAIAPLANQDTALEFYLEGNIVFRQAGRTVYADRMYYNVPLQYGVMLNGELLASIPDYQGLIRLKAEILQQVDPFRIDAYNAALTTSRLGVPRYWIQSELISYQSPTPLRGGARVTRGQEGLIGLPLSGSPQGTVSSRNNYFYLAGWPLLYWPFFATSLDRPTYYLESLRINNDNVFGQQVLTDWNLYQLLGIQNPPVGTEWTGSIDYLSERGIGVGSWFHYDREGLWGHPGHNRGFLDAWVIDEQGLDNLGADRRALAPEEDFRGRVLGRHRHDLPLGYQFNAEFGWISDRNFLEQYFEDEWDQQKDLRTGVELKRTVGNRSWSVSAQTRINDFFTETEELPRLEHFSVGRSILGDWLTWHEYSHVELARLEIAEAPLNAADAAKFDPLAWEEARDGLRAASRQEVGLPLQWGVVRLEPYVSGEAAFWQETLTADEVTRLLGQAGLRASLPMWRADPAIQDPLFNLNGLAHKIVWHGEFLWADADQPLAIFPLYDPLDDNAIEFFRRRFFFDTFGGAAGGDVRSEFDERFYALRSGLQRWVTSPSTEIADDLTALNLGLHQRWQTKRGMPGYQRVIDWITLDVDGWLYPDPDRDNFDQALGLLTYDLRWHVGDRLTLLSDGGFDFFDDGLRTISAGGIISRPGRGRWVLNFRSIEGPVSNNVISAAANYRLSHKWIFNYGTTIDLGDTGNEGYHAQMIRVGESFLVGIGARFDRARDNFGVDFSVMPRFLPTRMGTVAGVPIPPVGAMGVE